MFSHINPFTPALRQKYSMVTEIRTMIEDHTAEGEIYSDENIRHLDKGVSYYVDVSICQTLQILTLKISAFSLSVN